jgi:hypothetical protein
MRKCEEEMARLEEKKPELRRLKSKCEEALREKNEY